MLQDDPQDPLAEEVADTLLRSVAPEWPHGDAMVWPHEDTIAWERRGGQSGEWCHWPLEAGLILAQGARRVHHDRGH